MWHASLDTPYKRMMHSKWVSTLLLLGNVRAAFMVVNLWTVWEFSSEEKGVEQAKR
jgi:hypothetical protein